MSLFAELTNSVNAVRPGRTTMRNYDLSLVVASTILVAMGMLMVYSASIALVDGPKYTNFGRYYFVLRQGLFVAAGMFAATFALTVPVIAWQKYAVWVFGISAFLLLIILIPGVGRRVNHAVRWLPLGPITFQPSELMKIAALLFAADYTVRKQDQMNSFMRGFMPMAVALAVVGALLLKEPDLGALMVIVAIAFGILFLGGINAEYFQRSPLVC